MNHYSRADKSQLQSKGKMCQDADEEAQLLASPEEAEILWQWCFNWWGEWRSEEWTVEDAEEEVVLLGDSEEEAEVELLQPKPSHRNECWSTVWIKYEKTTTQNNYKWGWKIKS